MLQFSILVAFDYSEMALSFQDFFSLEALECDQNFKGKIIKITYYNTVGLGLQILSLTNTT